MERDTEKLELEFRSLVRKDKTLLSDFLKWLTPQAYETWHHYGGAFDQKLASKILMSNEVKIIGIDKKNKRIIVLGHLYSFSEKTCRLGIVSGITGKGYGTLMMGVLLEEARKRGVESIYLSTNKENLAAVKLYLRFGFKTVKEYSDRPEKVLEMEKVF